MVNEILNQLHNIVKANEEQHNADGMYSSIQSVIEYIYHHKDQ